MKVIVNDPMAALRQAKKAQVNAGFAALAAGNLHVEQAHAQKRLWAATNDERLKPEADLRGVTVRELASLILSKSDDTAAARELDRQKIMMQIDNAVTPADIESIRSGRQG